MTSLLIGYIIDLVIGDPHGFIHPIILIGNLIKKTETGLRKNFSKKNYKLAGVLLWLIVVFLSYFVPFLILFCAKAFNNTLAFAIECIMCYYILATKSLYNESMKVYYALKNENLLEARKYLSYIVGRDTKDLKEPKIASATIETVAENTTDGVVAPIIFMLIGGAPLGFAYKAINTLDSMVGYKNEKYKDLGYFSAKADDVANFIPARITAILMILASFILSMDFKNAYKIFLRDRYKHLSPNSAQTEAVCAGALDIMLGGDSFYFGKLVSKPTIGDKIREVNFEDIKKANKLMITTSVICMIGGTVIGLL